MNDNNIYINGSIGYIYLKNLKNNNQILLLSDNHSSQNYCSSDKIGNKFISDWLQSKNSKVLLEEVPQLDNELVELWSTKHEQKLKELYLQNKSIISIDGIDIRPILIKFSIEVFKLQIPVDQDYLNIIKKISLKDYLKILDLFFDLKHEYFIKTLENIYTIEKMDKKLSIHFFNLKNYFLTLKNEFNLQMNEMVFNLLQKNDILLDKLSYLLSSIMEWYTIAKISYNNKININKFIIHMGLFHITNLKNILINNYEYKMINSDGEININKIKDDENNCLKLPISVDSQFGGYFEKYKKYKQKYIALKKKI